MKKNVWVVRTIYLYDNKSVYDFLCDSRDEAREFKKEEKGAGYDARIYKYELVEEVR